MNKLIYLILFCWMTLRLSVSQELYMNHEKHILDQVSNFEIARVTKIDIHPDDLMKPTKAEETFLQNAPEDEDLIHPFHQTFKFNAFGEDLTLILRKSAMLIHPLYVQTTYENGEKDTKTRKDVINCFYSGYVESYGPENSFLTASTCDGGVKSDIEINGKKYRIEPLHLEHNKNHPKVVQKMALDDFSLDGIPHIVLNKENYPSEKPSKCGIGDSSSLEPEGGMKFVEVSDLETNSFTGDKIVEMHILNDFYRFEKWDVYTEIHTFELMNDASHSVKKKYYNTHTAGTFADNVEVVVKFQTTYRTAGDQLAVNLVPSIVSGAIDIDSYLIDLNTWNFGKAPALSTQTTKHDVVHILSGHDFRDNVIGYAYTFAMCSGSAVGINQVNHYNNDAFDAATIAHELGHNLGMCHDPPASRSDPRCNANPTTPCSGFIMSASSNPSNPATLFSTCSWEDYLQNKVATSNYACLNVPDVGSQIEWNAVTYSCGDSFVDINDTCCNSSNPGNWLDGSDCAAMVGGQVNLCCENCKIVNVSKVCRPKDGECDIEESCGIDGYCPIDTFRGDGTTCDPLPGESFVEQYWQEILMFFAVLLAFIIVYQCCKNTWNCLFGEGDEEMINKSRMDLSRNLSRDNLRRRKGVKPRGVQVKQGNSRQITLPDGWSIHYSADNRPVYMNKKTGEKYDFRTMP